MYYDYYDKIKHDLIDGENILWAGKPKVSFLVSKYLIFIILFGIMWLGLNSFMFYSAILTFIYTGVIFPLLFGIPFLAIGFILTLGVPLYFRRIKKNTEYCITNKRIMIFKKSRKGREMETTFIKDIKAINTKIKSNGIGTIIFGSNTAMANMGVNAGFAAYGGGQYGSYYGEMCPVFFDIPDADKVYRIAYDAWSKTKKAI